MSGVVAVALNPALDITYDLDAPLQPGTTYRVAAMHERAGGKALNVANVLCQLGRDDVTVVAFLAGKVGRRIAAMVPAGITLAAVEVAGETRRTVVVTSPAGPTDDRTAADDGRADRSGDDVTQGGGLTEATSFNEAGPSIDDDAWRRMRAAVADHLPARALVISGSNAAGAPADAVAQLTALAVANATPVFADTSTGLPEIIAAGAAVVKPNRAELAAAVGDVGGGTDELVAAARRLAAGTGATVLASDAEAGLVAVSGDAALIARPPVCDGNATGAGDAALAGFVHAALSRQTLAEAVRLAAGCGAAAVLRPIAGEIDTDKLATLLDATTVTASGAGATASGVTTSTGTAASTEQASTEQARTERARTEQGGSV